MNTSNNVSKLPFGWCGKSRGKQELLVYWGVFQICPPTHINTNRINPRCDLSAKMKQYLSVILHGEPNCSVRESRCAPSSFAYILEHMHIQGSHLPICGTTTNASGIVRLNVPSNELCSVIHVDVQASQVHSGAIISSCCCWWDRSWSLGVWTRARHWTRRAKVEGSGLRAWTPWPWTRASFAC